MTWRVAALDGSHDLTAFSCGNLKLDTWLRDHAVLAAGQGTRTFAVVDNEDVVVGYFAITPHLIDRPDAPIGSLREGLVGSQRSCSPSLP